MKKILLFILSLFILNFLFLGSVSANGIVQCGGRGQEPCGIEDFLGLIGSVTDIFIRQVIPGAAVIMLIIGGLFFLFSGGDPNVANIGKTIIKVTIIGLVLVYGAYIIINTILAIIGFTGTWDAL